MITPNTQTQALLFPATDSELSHSHEYYQHKANECRELIDSLADWEVVPDSAIDFAVGGQRVAAFKIRQGENVLLQAVLINLLSYYQRMAGEVKSQMAANDISQVQNDTGLS